MACPSTRQVLSGLIFWVLDPAFLDKVGKDAEVEATFSDRGVMNVRGNVCMQCQMNVF